MKISTGGNDYNIDVGVRLNDKSKLKARNELESFIQQAKKTSDIKLDIKIDSKGIKSKIETIKTETGDLVQITKKYGQQNQILDISVNKLQRSYDTLSTSVKRVEASQQALNKTAKHSVSIFQDFADTFAKMAKFNTVNLIYDGLIDKMSEAIQITNEFDAAMIEFQKVTDTSNVNLEDYTETLGKLGEQTAKTTTQMLQMATEFSKGGFNADDSAKLANVASLYQNIADAEISAGDAASFIISQMKAFGKEITSVEDAVKIVDKVNEISNNFAVSSSDIASALTKQSASLASYGNTLGESIALVTSGAEIMTHQSGKVARGLRTIGANITQLAQGAKTFEIQVAGATKSIQLWNDAGTDMLNTYEVLEQISQVWDDMTNAEKSSLAIGLAKKTQMDTFLAVMNNFETAEKAYTKALLAEGSALQENERYMQGIEAHQQALKAQWEQLVLSVPFEKLEKAILDAGTALLKFANNDTVQLIAKITALATVVALSATAFEKLFVFFNAKIVLTSAITSLITGEATLTQVTSLLTATMLENPLFWGAAGVALVVGLAKAIDYFIVTVEEANEALGRVNGEVAETTNNIQSLKDQIKEIGERIDELNAKKLEISNPSQLASLQQQTNELTRQEVILRNQLEIEKQKLEAQRQQQAEAARQAMNSKSSVSVYNSGDARVSNFEQQGLTNMFFGNTREAGEVLIEAMRNTQEAINKCRDSMRGLNEESDEYAQHVDEAKALSDQYAEMSEQLQPILENAEAIIEAGEDENGMYQALIDSLSELNELKAESNDTSLGTIEDETDALYDNVDAIEEATNAWTSHVDALSEIQSVYDTLSNAVAQYNEQGYFTADMLSQLNALSPEYLSALEKEGDQYTINTDKLAEQFEAEKQDAIEKLELAKCIGTVELAQQYLNGTMGEATGVIAAGGNAAETTAGQMLDLASASNQAAQAVANVMAAFGAESQNFANFQKDLVGLEKTYNDLIKNIQSTEFNLAKGVGGGGHGGGSGRKGGGGGGGSRKGRSGGGGGSRSSGVKTAAKEHVDAWLEAFKKEQEALKHSLEVEEITQYEYYERLKDLNEKYFGEISGNHEKYIKEYNENEEEIYKGLKTVYNKVKNYLREAVEQGYERAINAIKKEEKAVLAKIKNEIESLKKEKKEVLDGIQDEIDALKKEKKEVEKYWNDQIEAIKRENEVLQEQNQLLEYQQALERAKAQKVMIYQDGKFQLGENESAVAEAEQNLANYQDQLAYEEELRKMEELRDTQLETLEQRIEALEEYYDYMEEYYDRRIDSMEEYYDRVEEQYEKQIEALQNELDAFKEAYQKQEDLENARLAAQVLGMNERKDLYSEELENLKNYINEVNRMLAVLGDAGKEVDYSYNPITGYHKHVSEVSSVGVATRASGDASFKGDEIALVGESPNAELVLGSRLNNSVNSGQLVHLSRGSGIVNAESTSTLAGLLNSLGGNKRIDTNRSTQQHFNFGNISLPNVTDANSFVNTLSRQFNNYAIQYGNIKR